MARKGVESPRLQIELLLAHVLQMPRLKLYLSFERALTEAELARLRELVRRRGEREPLQHLTGSTSFCGHEIGVTPAVLIPRPETEQLVELALAHLARVSSAEANGRHPSRTSLAPGDAPPLTMIDFGTGSGCIAIALALRCPSAEIHALDISAAALEVARDNASRHGVTQRVHFHLGDGFAALPRPVRADLIVSNPPYVPRALLDQLDPEVRHFDPRQALDGGPDGLDFFRRLALEAGPYLKPTGWLIAEFGDDQAAAVGRIFADAGWTVEGVTRDLSGRERLMVARPAL